MIDGELGVALVGPKVDRSENLHRYHTYIKDLSRLCSFNLVGSNLVCNTRKFLKFIAKRFYSLPSVAVIIN